jgi:hypothetical protein
MAIENVPIEDGWNYFIALEQDLETLSRYIEFAEKNFATYSIELAHLLFAAASEVDVIARDFYARFAPNAARANINDFFSVFATQLPQLRDAMVFVPRHGLRLKPWISWERDTPPEWWTGYNKVKHQRKAEFQLATLKNALNAMAALQSLLVISSACLQRQTVLFVMQELDPQPRLLYPENTIYRTRLLRR